jgi:hypothetical protein
MKAMNLFLNISTSKDLFLIHLLAALAFYSTHWPSKSSEFALGCAMALAWKSGITFNPFA